MLGTFAGLMWGLLVSAVAPSEDRAMLLVILVLVPQFIFSGGMMPVSDLGVAGKVFGRLTSTRWGLGAMATSRKIKTGAGKAADMSDSFLPGIKGLKTTGEKVAMVQALDSQYGAIFNVNVAFYWAMSHRPDPGPAGPDLRPAETQGHALSDWPAADTPSAAAHLSFGAAAREWTAGRWGPR